MRNIALFGSALAVAVLASSYLALAQNPPAGQAAAGQGRGQQAPPQPMSFFVTSAGKGDGANLGGLAGADAHCQTLAAAAGRGGVTWHAYLSTQGAGAVNARDRIGSGPWYNQRGQRIAQNLGELHGDTVEQARMGNALGKALSPNEKGAPVNGVGDTPNQHDILTGSQPDGRAYTDTADHTCNNWTSNSTGTAQLGHSDKQGGGNGSWNSSHASRGCSQADLVGTGGAGLLYCFAVN
ncbi:MAG: lectin [Luteitalea sp.]|nr:lectin [Luteitalea sp.]